MPKIPSWKRRRHWGVYPKGRFSLQVELTLGAPMGQAGRDFDGLALLRLVC